MPYQVDQNHPNKLDKTFLPCAKVMGAYNKRQKPYRPASVINVSAMSFGSLSAKAIESLNKGVLNLIPQSILSKLFDGM